MVEVEVVSPIEVSAEVQKYTLVSDDIYVRRYDSSTVPDWYKSLIESIIASNAGITDIQSAIDFLTLQGNGYAQSIVELHTADSSTNAALETLTSQVGENTAGIGTINVTKVDRTAATAIATNVVGSAFGEGGTANSWFTSKISTYASNTQANTESITTLNASLGSTNVRIDTVDAINISQGTSISQLTANTAIAIADLQGQIDGSISTWFYNGSPEYSAADTTPALLSTSTDTGIELVTGAHVFDTIHNQMYSFIPVDELNVNLTLENLGNTLRWLPIYKLVEPELTWVTIDTTNGNNIEKDNHLGDIYYDMATGFGYRYAKVDILNDNPDLGVVYTWVSVTDALSLQALEAASHAQNTADGKRTVFYMTTAPVDQVISGTLIPIEEGDLWVNSTTKITKIYAKTSTNPDVFQWVDITNTATENALIGLGTLEETNDGVVYTYYSPTAPTLITHPTMSYGDWWVDTDAVPTVKVYRYEDINGKTTTDLVTYPLAWREKDPTTNILANNAIASDKVAKVIDGTLAINITSATVNGTAIGTYVAGEIDKEVVVFSGTDHTAQVGMKLNDIYLEKTTDVGISGIVVDVVNTWKYNGTIWESIGSNDNLTALADLADGKRTIFSNVSNDVPVGEVNDVWMPTTGTNDTTWIPGEIYRYNGSTWVISTRYSANIVALQNTLQDQIDGKVDTYYQETVPYADQTNVPKDIRGGDYWYCTVNVSTYIKGNVYKYVETVNGSNYNYTWTLTADVTKSAFDAIDGKKTIFGGATAPTAIAVDDIWIPSANVGTYKLGFIYQWNGTTWDANVKYTDDTMASAMTTTYYSATVPTVGVSFPYLADGDQWVPPADTGTYKANSLYTYLSGVWVASTTESAEYAKNQLGATMYNSPNATTPVAIAPAVLAIGDLWVVTDRWYRYATTTSSSLTGTADDITARTTYGHLIRKYDGSTWPALTNVLAAASSLKWSAKSSKFITAPDGSITGFEMSDGSATNSAFTITADTFKVVASGQTAASKTPLTVDAATGEITFNGKVSFNSVTDVVVDSIDNINHIFEEWGTTYPTGYSVWVGTTGIISKETSIIKNGANALKIVSTAGGNGGLNFNAPVLFKSPTNMDYDYVTISVDVYLESGTFAGSGIRIDWINTVPTTYSTYIHFNLEFPSATTGRWYTVTKTIPKNVNFTGTFSTMDGYLFGHYSGCNGGIATANSIIVDRLTIRAATTAEVLSIGALPSSSDLASIINAGTTTIEGGKITTGTVMAETLNADSINGKVIIGAEIHGALITGTVIKSSWIDYTSTGMLTNWQYFDANNTDGKVDAAPDALTSGYALNFAYTPGTTTLVVDSLGYARLQGYSIVYSTQQAEYSDGVCSYDSYTTISPKRVITSTPTFVTNSAAQSYFMYAYGAAYNESYTNSLTVALSFRVGNISNTITRVRHQNVYPNPYTETITCISNSLTKTVVQDADTSYTVQTGTFDGVPIYATLVQNNFHVILDNGIRVNIRLDYSNPNGTVYRDLFGISLAINQTVVIPYGASTNTANGGYTSFIGNRSYTYSGQYLLVAPVLVKGYGVFSLS